MVSEGAARFDLEFFTSDMRDVVGEGGGVLHAIIGTLMITLLATLISVPVGILCGIYLVEYGKGHLARWVTFLVDVMTGIPSIVAGLFAFALFAFLIGPGYKSGFAGAIALDGADDPDGRPRHRGDAQARPERAARGLLRARACRSGGPSPRW